MTQEIKDFLGQNRIAVVTILLPDGSPHGATVHYSHINEPLEIYVSTDKNSKKCQALQTGESAKASCVIGFNEEEMKTMQMDGDITQITDAEELRRVDAIHYAKHPHAAKYKDAPERVTLKFIPIWWRYSDYKATPRQFIES